MKKIIIEIIDEKIMMDTIDEILTGDGNNIIRKLDPHEICQILCTIMFNMLSHKNNQKGGIITI